MSLKLKPLIPRDPSEAHRAATQLELFFDLVTVIAIATATAALHHAISEGHGLDILAPFLFAMFAVWWPWLNFTWFASAFDNDDALYRVTTVAIMGGYLMFASGVGRMLVPGGFDPSEFGVGVAGWVIIRLGMVLNWLRAAFGSPANRRTALRYAVGITLAQIAWIVLFFTMHSVDAAFYIGGALVIVFEMLVPIFAEKASVTPYHRHHIIERYGLLNIIVLGEALLALGLSFNNLFGDHFDWQFVWGGWLGLIIVFVLWWIYFIEEEHLSDPSFGRAFLWGYGHFFVFVGGAITGAGLGAVMDTVAHHSHISAGEAAGWVNGAVALYLATLWLIRDRFVEIGWRSLVLLVATLVFIGAAWLGLSLVWTAVLAVATLLARIEIGRD